VDCNLMDANRLDILVSGRKRGLEEAIKRNNIEGSREYVSYISYSAFSLYSTNSDLSLDICKVCALYASDLPSNTMVKGMLSVHLICLICI